MNAAETSSNTSSGKDRLAGRYVLVRQLGSGGMGSVYHAFDEVLRRDVALKRVLLSFKGEQRRKMEALFEREYYTLVRLRHPRIIDVYDYGVSETGPYYTMELLDGADLHAHAPLPYRELCRHLRDIASSLALVHAHQLVHRDVSPRNIRFSHAGRAKLIDFGALAPFGTAPEVAGTPACMAPEVMHGMPLDQRTDLFALGAVAYWALTGRPAYHARRLSELRSVWTTPPAPPSKLVAGIPHELDSLVLSLINLDPLARPANAAVVIEQLTSIGGLEPEEHDPAAEAYVTSSRFVGRDTELAWLERRIERSLQGQGSEVIIEGPGGIGKTRLLRETALRAQLKGATVIHADAQAVPGSFGVASALSLQLLQACPETALATAGPHRELLGHLSTELWDKLGRLTLTPLDKNPGERRVRLQTALYDWFQQVLAERRLCIAVDNLHAADDNSAAFLAALGHKAHELPVMILLTQRTGELAVARGPVGALRRRAGRLTLGSLTSASYIDLVTSLFGEVANVGRMAQLLYDRSAGNPQQTMHSVQLLVKNKVVKYVGGTWVLPFDVSHSELPSRLEHLIAARLAAVSPSARKLAEVLSLQSKPLSIELCRALVQGHTDAEFHAALDELVTERIFAVEGANYRFAQVAVRQAVLATLDASARSALHRHAAEVFLSLSHRDLAARMEAGWHLLRAGEEDRGAEILAAAGAAFVADQSGGEASEQAVRALHAVLDIYERRGRSDYEIARVLFPLLPLAYFVDFRLVNEYAERAMELGLRLTGLADVPRLRRVLGPSLALKVALLRAKARFAVERRRGLDYDLAQAIGQWCAIIPSVAGVAATCLDTERLERMIRLVEPLSLFPKNEFPRLIYDHLLAETAQNTMRGESAGMLRDVARRFHDPKIVALLGEGHWKAIYGGLSFMVGLTTCFGLGSEPLERARELEELGVRVWAMTADHLRLFHRALRGESEQMREYLARVEVFAVQGSTTWQAEMFYPALLINAYMLWEDAVAVRRVCEQLTRRAEEVASLEPHAQAAHAVYLSVRGDTAAAIDEFERVLKHFEPRARINWSTLRGCFAATLNAAGQHERARQVASEVLDHATVEERALAVLTFEAERQLALAEAGLGNEQDAQTRLDGMLAEWNGTDQPLLLGLLHEARAEVALTVRDAPAFEIHARAMDELFRGVRNPALIAKCERLQRKAARAGLWNVAGEQTLFGTASAAGAGALEQLRQAADPCKQALAVLMQRAGARSGQLYVSWDGEIGLACQEPPYASAGDLEPELRAMVHRAQVDTTKAEEYGSHPQLGSNMPFDPDTLLVPLSACSTYAGALGASRSGDASETATTLFLRSVVPEAQDGAHQLFVLSTRRGKQPLVVGGLILEMEARHRPRLQTGLLEAVAAILDERLGETVNRH